MNYQLVFDVEQAGYRNWWAPAFGLLVLAIGLGILTTQVRNPTADGRPGKRWFAYLFTGLGVAWIVVAFVGTYHDYLQLSDALRSGNFEVVEGKVDDFVPLPANGRGRERFNVHGHHYEYSDNNVVAGFNNTQSHGGPIRQGLRKCTSRTSAVKSPGWRSHAESGSVLRQARDHLVTSNR